MMYTLKLWRDDMGTLSQPGVESLEDALWYVNSARAHDGLQPLTLLELEASEYELQPQPQSERA